MRRTKKWAALLLSTAMVVSTLAGCGSSSSDSTGTSTSANTDAAAQDADSETTAASEKEEVDLTLVYPVSGNFADQDMVSEAIAELAKRDLNVNLTVLPMTISDIMAQSSLMIAAGESIDVFPNWASTVASFVDSGYVLDLSEYLDDMPNTLEWVGREDVETCNVGGYIWGVTTMRERCNPQCITMRKDLLDEIGVSIDDLETLDDVTEVYAQLHELYPDMIMLGGSSTEGLGYAGDMAYNMDPLNDELGVLDNFGQELTVVNEFESENWIELVYQMREWYEAGYVSKDMATSSDSGSTLMMAGNLFSYMENYKPNTKEEKMSQMGIEVEVFHITEPLSHTTSVSGLGYAVNGVTEYPERAVELLDWLEGSGEVNDLMNFGVEGVHWVENEDGTASYPDGVTLDTVGYHLDWGWAIPNQFAGHLWEGNDPDLLEIYNEWREGGQKSKAFGFSFDSSSVTDEVIACTAVLTEWLPQITTGSVEPDAAIASMNEALYAAGLQTVMDEKQRQLDEWAAEHE